jgi:hypothetical protein
MILNDLVEQLSGRKPLAMRDYITKNEALFSPGVPNSFELHPRNDQLRHLVE